MKKSQQGAAVAVIVVGLLVLAAGGAVLISQLLKERSARQRLESEVSELQQKIDSLKRAELIEIE